MDVFLNEKKCWISLALSLGGKIIGDLKIYLNYSSYKYGIYHISGNLSLEISHLLFGIQGRRPASLWKASMEMKMNTEGRGRTDMENKA